MLDLAMYGIARRTKHANQITVDAKASLIGTILNNVSIFLKRLSSSAEQWTQPVRWWLILSAAFRVFLRRKSSEVLLASPQLPLNCRF